MPAAPAPVAAATGIRPPAVDRRRLALAIAFISGLTSLGYQVTWNRLLGAGTGSSTYVFTVILVLFLIGIATGAILLGFIRSHVRSIAGLIGVAQLLTAVLVTLGAAILASPSSPFLGSSTQFLDALREFARTSALVVLPPTIVMGLTFPATAALLGDETGSEGTATGSLVAVNTIGAIVATFVLPFFVIPLIGSPATLAGLALINVGVGAFLLVGLGRTHAVVRALGSVAAAGIAIAIVVSFVAGTAFRNPTTTLIVSHGGQIFEATEDEIAPVVAGQARLPAAVGQRDVDDADHRRHQADADPAADAPARVAEGPRDRVRDGDRVPELAHRRDQDGRGRARAVRARHVQVVLLGRRRRCSRTRTATSSSPTAGTTWS